MSVETLSTAEATALAVLADQVIPRSGEFPAASDLDLAGDRLSRLAQLRPGLLDGLKVALAYIISAEVEDAFGLRARDPQAFLALTDTVASLYLTDPDVMTLLGYPGRVSLAGSDDLEERAREQWDLTTAVRSRGFIWKPTDG